MISRSWHIALRRLRQSAIVRPGCTMRAHTNPMCQGPGSDPKPWCACL